MNTSEARLSRAVLLVILLCAGSVYASAQTRPRIELDGAWQFRMDPQGAGRTEGWYSGRVNFPDTIRVPGCWQAQGFGTPSGILRNHYAGDAWYRKTVAVPADWKGKSIQLNVGGVSRRATIYIDGKAAGMHDGFSAPFALDVTDAVEPGRENTIAFLVSNPGAPITESPDVQKATEPTGMFNYIGNWGGIYGSVTLEASDPARIEDVAISSDVQKSQARFLISVRDRSAKSRYSARLEVVVDGKTASNSVQVEPGNASKAELIVDLPGAVAWTPDTPHLYTATVRLVQGERERDRVEQRFGLREVTTRGNVLLLNGRPLYLRGYGDDNIEVLTGIAPASKDELLKRIRRAKEYGFNAVRYHSMVPRQEFFEAADEAGLLVLAELPAAYTMYVLPHREFLRRELESVLRVHRNHPSFLSLAFGNEFNLDWLKTPAEKQEFQALVQELYKFGKSVDPNRLLLSNDGLVLRPTDMVSVFEGPAQDLPAIRHEFGEYYCSLPDISLTKRFAGVISPDWLVEKGKWVESNQLSERYGTYVLNSQRLQQLGRKYQIEKARTKAEFTGYAYWLITDYPGGTGEGDSWEEGWFNYFWEPKGIEPRAGLEINAGTLLMIDAGVGDRTLWADSGKQITVSVSNYGDEPIENGTLTWSLLYQGKAIAGASVGGVHAPLGKISRIGSISLGPIASDEAEKLELRVDLKGPKATHSNRWDFWAFPRQQLARTVQRPVVSNVKWAGLRRLYPFITDVITEVNAPEHGLLITSALDRDAMKYLESGGRVWLMGGEAQFGHSGDATFFSASGGAVGTAIQSHPALRGFPQDGFFDLQFFNLMEGAWHYSLDAWPKEFTPIAGGIRTKSSFLSKQKDLSRVGYIFETKVGQGSLLVTTLSLREHFDEAYPEAIYLFDRLLRYATGPEFQPQAVAGPDVLRKLTER